MVPKKESLISKRYIITIAAIFSSLIIAVSLSFNIATRKCSRILEDSLFQMNRLRLLDTARNSVSRLNTLHVISAIDISDALRTMAPQRDELIYAILYARTDDENYFRIVEKIPLGRIIPDIPEKRDVVQEGKERNYIKKGFIDGIVEPRIYSSDNIFWQNVYFPYRAGKRQYCIQFMINCPDVPEALSNFSSSVRRMQIIMIVLTVVLVAAVIVTTLVFIQNFSMLISNLSVFMKKAADGDLEVNLNPSPDVELNQLALSFNSLIGELKDRSMMEADPLKSIFNTGVAMLKENRLDDSIAIFTALTVLRPDGFGNFFNLGVAYARKKKYDSSLDMFSRALKANPDNDITKKYLAKVKKLLSPNGTR